MDRTAAQALRVLGIVVISMVIIVAALIFAIASMCGLWSSSSTGDESAKLMIGIGCPVIFIGGIFLIAKLAKGMARSRREWKATIVDGVPGEAAALQERDLVLETEPLLHLRIAVAARILLSAAMVTYHQVQPTSYGHQYLIAAVLGLLVYEAPNGWVLWRIREKLDWFAVLLAVAYAAVSLLWTMWNFTVYLRFLRLGHNPQVIATWLLPAAAEVAIVVIGWRARTAMPRREDDDSTFAAGFGIALIYTFIAYGLTSIFYRMRPF
jgi:hypothetical protein